MYVYTMLVCAIVNYLKHAVHTSISVNAMHNTQYIINKVQQALVGACGVLHILKIFEMLVAVFFKMFSGHV